MDVTIKDIAAAAGVRPGVVSVVLNNKSYTRVSQARRDEIRRIADEMGYRPNLQASSLRKGKTPAVGVFLPPWRDVLLLELVHGLAEGSETHRIPLTYSFGMTAESYFDFIDSMASYRHTGIVSYVPFWNSRYDRILERLQQYMDNGGFVISLNTVKWPMEKSVSLDFDNHTGGRLGAEYLLRFPELRSFELLTLKTILHELRDSAFVETLRNAGREATVHQMQLSDELTAGQMNCVIDAMFDQTEFPCGIFATSSEFARLVFVRAAERGLKNNQDYRLIGYDFAPLHGDCEPIARIIQPFRELGSLAVGKLNTLLSHKEASSEIIQPVLEEPLG